MSASYGDHSAAVSLCELWEREGNGVLKPLTHDPRRSETILLAARRLGDAGQSQATLFVRAILESDSEYEDVLHRDLFLAARCLGSGASVDGELRAEIVERLCGLYFDSKSPPSLREDIRETFALLGAATDCDDLIEILLGRLPDAEWDMRSAAASALGSIGEKAAREDVIAALLERLSDARDSVRGEAARALGALASKVQSHTKPAVIKLVLPHVRNKRRGEKSDIKREAGYVALRNLMSAGVSEIGEAV